MEEKSDKELLKMIYLGVQESQKKLTSIETSVSALHTTVYGDEDRNIKGLSHHIEVLRKFMEKYKKWEFAIGLFVGFFGFLGMLVLGINQLIK